MVGTVLLQNKHFYFEFNVIKLTTTNSQSVQTSSYPAIHKIHIPDLQPPEYRVSTEVGKGNNLRPISIQFFS